MLKTWQTDMVNFEIEAHVSLYGFYFSFWNCVPLGYNFSEEIKLMNPELYKPVSEGWTNFIRLGVVWPLTGVR